MASYTSSTCTLPAALETDVSPLQWVLSLVVVVLAEKMWLSICGSRVSRFRDQATVLPTLQRVLFCVSLPLVVVVLSAKMICGSRVRPFQRSSNDSAHPLTG